MSNLKKTCYYLILCLIFSCKPSKKNICDEDLFIQTMNKYFNKKCKKENINIKLNSNSTTNSNLSIFEETIYEGDWDSLSLEEDLKNLDQSYVVYSLSKKIDLNKEVLFKILKKGYHIAERKDRIEFKKRVIINLNKQFDIKPKLYDKLFSHLYKNISKKSEDIIKYISNCDNHLKEFLNNEFGINKIEDYDKLKLCFLKALSPKNQIQPRTDFLNTNYLKGLNENKIKESCGNKFYGLLNKNNIDEKEVNNYYEEIKSRKITSIETPLHFCNTTFSTEKLLDFKIPAKAEYIAYLEIYKDLIKKLDLMLPSHIIKAKDISTLLSILLKNIPSIDLDKKTILNIINKLGFFLREVIGSKECIDNYKNTKLNINGKTVEENIKYHLENLEKKGYKSLAIRSSSIWEDNDANPAAGLYETKIGVPINNIDKVFEAIADVIKSMWSEAALSKSIQNKNTIRKNEMGVIIQGLFPSHISGIAYSKCPFDPSLAVITLAPGQGDYLVSGKISGLNIYISREDLNEYVNGNKSLDEIKIIESKMEEGSYDKYLYIDENGIKETKKLNKQVPVNPESLTIYMLNFLGIKSVKNNQGSIFIKNLFKEVKKVATNCYLSEIKNGSPRDQEFAMRIKQIDNKEKNKDSFDINGNTLIFKDVLLQDRTLPEPKNKLYLDQKDYQNFSKHNFSQFKPLSHGIGEGIVINEKDFIELMRNNKGGNKKFIIFAENNANENMNKYLSNISGIIVKNGTSTDHMSNVCNLSGIPLMKIDTNENIDELKSNILNEYITSANVIVKGEIKNIFIKGNYNEEIIKVSKETPKIKDIIRNNKINFKNQSQKISQKLKKLCKEEYIDDQGLDFKFINKIKFPSIPTEWGQLFKIGLELNDLLLNQSFHTSLNQILNSNFDQIEKEITDFKKYLLKKEGKIILDDILNNLRKFTETYLGLFDMEDFPQKYKELFKYIDTKDFFKGLKTLVKNIRECLTIIEYENINDLKGKKKVEIAFYKLKNLILDNGVEEDLLLYKNPKNLKSVQEFIRYIHRILFSSFNRGHAEKLNIQKKEDSKFILIGNIPVFFRKIIDKLEKDNKNKKGILTQGFAIEEFLHIDIPIGWHSADIKYIRDIKGNNKNEGPSDSDRIEYVFRQTGQQAYSLFRPAFIYCYLEYLKQKENLKNLNFEKPAYLSCIYSWYFNYVNFENIKEIYEIIDHFTVLLNNIKNIDTIDEKIRHYPSFLPLFLFKEKIVSYDLNFFKSMRGFLDTPNPNIDKIYYLLSAYVEYNYRRSALLAYLGEDILEKILPFNDFIKKTYNNFDDLFESLDSSEYYNVAYSEIRNRPNKKKKTKNYLETICNDNKQIFNALKKDFEKFKQESNIDEINMIEFYEFLFKEYNYELMNKFKYDKSKLKYHNYLLYWPNFKKLVDNKKKYFIKKFKNTKSI